MGRGIVSNISVKVLIENKAARGSSPRYGGRPRVFLAGGREPWPGEPGAAAPLGRTGVCGRWDLDVLRGAGNELRLCPPAETTPGNFCPHFTVCAGQIGELEVRDHIFDFYRT